jgi:DNA-directed RNA polymerase subunit M/transcription elongation factor TFIIS
MKATSCITGVRQLEFCEKCGAMMLPKKKDGKTVLICRECGHEKPAGSGSLKVEYRIKHSPREKIVVVEEDSERKEDISEDERRERRKAILEFYESED